MSNLLRHIRIRSTRVRIATSILGFWLVLFFIGPEVISAVYLNMYMLSAIKGETADVAMLTQAAYWYPSQRISYYQALLEASANSESARMRFQDLLASNPFDVFSAAHLSELYFLDGMYREAAHTLHHLLVTANDLESPIEHLLPLTFQRQEPSPFGLPTPCKAECTLLCLRQRFEASASLAGIMAFERGNIAEARDLFSLTLKSSPRDVLARYYLAITDPVDSQQSLGNLADPQTCCTIPVEPRLVEYLPQIASTLQNEKIWDQEKVTLVLNLVAWYRLNSIDQKLRALRTGATVELSDPVATDQSRGEYNYLKTFLINQLHLQPWELTLGPNLLPNGSFEEGILWPEKWTWTLSFGDRSPSKITFDDGVFVGGLDGIAKWDGEQSARILGLWTGSLDSASQSKYYGGPARGGFGSPHVTLVPGRIYVLSFRYRTSMDGAPKPRLDHTSFWCPSMDDFWLPPSPDVWRWFVCVGRNESRSTESLGLGISNWGTGSVWIDSVELRKVDLSVDSTQVELPIVAIR